MGNKSAQRVLLYPERWPFETYTQPDVKKPQCSKIENIISNHTLKEDVSDENRPKFEELYSLENMSREKFLLAYFRYNHIRYIDVRYNNGSIWVVDRPGVKEQLDRLKKYGFYFMFTKNGSHTSDHKPAFWLPNRYLE